MFEISLCHQGKKNASIVLLVAGEASSAALTSLSFSNLRVLLSYWSRLHTHESFSISEWWRGQYIRPSCIMLFQCTLSLAQGLAS